MNTIIPFMSEKRLSKYGVPTNPYTHRLYFFNVRLCESMYPSLSQFEIVLRNKIDAVLSHHIGENWIFDFVRADEKLNEEKDITDRNELIDSLTFGFWSRLFMSQNCETIWDKYPTALQEIFNRRQAHLALPKISYEIDTIRKYRNRFSHNGSLLICSKHQMPCHKIHNLIFRMLRELGANPVLNQLKKIDRFNEVFTDGKKAGFITCKI